MGNPEKTCEFPGAPPALRLMRVLVIDEQSLFLSSFGPTLLRCAANVSLVNVETAAAAHSVLADEPGVDVVLLNLQRADGSGFEMLAALSSAHETTPVLVTSGVDTNAEIVRAIYFGATGFVPIGAGSDMFLEALRVVRSGQIFMPPMFIRGQSVSDLSSRDTDRDANLPLSLTRRQGDVLELLMEGQSNKSMARRLNLSVETIKDHVAGLLRTLNVKSRTQAVIAASRMGDWPTVVGRRDGFRHRETSLHT